MDRSPKKGPVAQKKLRPFRGRWRRSGGHGELYAVVAEACAATGALWCRRHALEREHHTALDERGIFVREGRRAQPLPPGELASPLEARRGKGCSASRGLRPGCV